MCDVTVADDGNSGTVDADGGGGSGTDDDDDGGGGAVNNGDGMSTSLTTGANDGVANCVSAAADSDCFFLATRLRRSSNS